MSAGCINQTNGTPAAIRTLMAGLEDRCTIPCATGALWSLVGGLNSVSAGYEPARYADSRAIGVRGGSRTRKTCILSAVPMPIRLHGQMVDVTGFEPATFRLRVCYSAS